MKKMIFAAIMIATFGMPVWAQSNKTDVAVRNFIQLGEPVEYKPDIVAYLKELLNNDDSRKALIKSVFSDRVISVGSNTVKQSPVKLKFKIGDTSSFGCLYDLYLKTASDEPISIIRYYQNGQLLNDDWLNPNKRVFLSVRDNTTVLEKQSRQFVKMFALGVNTPFQMLSRIGYNLADDNNYAVFKTIMKHSGLLVSKDDNFVKVRGTNGTEYNIKINKGSEFIYMPKKLQK